MKVLHVTFGFPPDPPGGTELYVSALCRDLAASGVRSVVAAPGLRDQAYVHDGIAVRRFGINQHDIDLAELYGAGDPRAAAAFELILDDVRPDLVHQHALTSACSLELARRVKARGLPLVFTYHTPGTTCQRGTLLEWGEAPCDGRLETRRCAACTLHGLGVGRNAARLFSCTPHAVGRLIGRAGLHGGLWTAGRMADLTEQRGHAITRFFDLVDQFVALTPWVRSVLTMNGVPASKIVDCPHGTASAVTVRAHRPGANRGQPLRMAYLGRLDPVKGVEILVRAVRALPSVALRLDIFAVVQSATDQRVKDRVTAAVGVDSRIRLLAPIEHSQVLSRLADYDLIAVPSQSIETGPLIVLEAFAAGVPVIGSALGGLADKVVDGVNGVLVRPHGSVDAWSAALTGLERDRDVLARLSGGATPVRSSTDVAGEMFRLYAAMVNSRPVAA